MDENNAIRMSYYPQGIRLVLNKSSYNVDSTSHSRIESGGRFPSIWIDAY